MKKYIMGLLALVLICAGSYYAYAAREKSLPLLQVDNLIQFVPEDAADGRTFSWQDAGNNGSFTLEYRKLGDKLISKADTITSTVPAYKKDETTQTMYAAYVKGLQPKTTYEYRLVTAEKATAWQQFTTTDKDLNKYKVMVYGDSQAANYNVWGKVAQAGYERNKDAAFFINMGDLVDNGQDRWQWREWFKNARPLLDKMPVAPVIGNHEAYSLDWKVAKPETFPAILAVPENGPEGQKRLAYSFNYGDVHFVALNTNYQETKDWYPDMIEKEAAWLDKDLAKARADHKRIIVLMHRPPWEYPFNGPYDPHGEAFVPLLDKYQVELAFTAHVHSYSRTYPWKNGGVSKDGSGTTYICTGRTGEKVWEGSIRKTFDEVFYNPLDMPMYLTLEIEPDNFKVTAHKEDGTVIDTAVIKTEK